MSSASRYRPSSHGNVIVPYRSKKWNAEGPFRFNRSVPKNETTKKVMRKVERYAIVRP